MNYLLILIAAIFTLIALFGCSFGHKEYEQSKSPLNTPDDYVIQIDDFGKFWNREEAQRALEEIQRSSEKTNTIVLIYIHGWHHNAKSDNGNVKNFANSLRQVRKKLHDFENGIPGVYRESRRRLTGDGDVKVIGLYIGWRGKSLPMPLNFLTFWGRKSVAERIGRGDLREFFKRLDRLYTDRNSLGESGEKVPFMGMASFGHSFGGQVLFSSIKSMLEDGLIEATSKGRKVQSDLPKKPIHGFGTLAILINPALEAHQYEKIHELSKKIRYEPSQTPLLMVVSAETDLARKRLFPIGRWFGSLSEPAQGRRQKETWTQALGEFELHRTHSVKLLKTEPSDVYKGFDPAIYNDDPCAILNFDLTNVPEIGGIRLEPIGDHQPYNPFLVAYADGKLVIKHSGIFEKRLRDFLNDYVAMAEGKRILLRDPESKQCLDGFGSVEDGRERQEREKLE